GNLRVGQVILIPAGFNLSNLPFWFHSMDVQDFSPEKMTDNRDMTYYPEETYSYTTDSGDTQ
ncbi:hypothetical protein, partial [Lacrimispora sp.]|uniref:hypothetical protein n=1 Tax=Lacrimispora sp. TaxID=2719234 RepID=UPI0028A89D66